MFELFKKKPVNISGQTPVMMSASVSKVSSSDIVVGAKKPLYALKVKIASLADEAKVIRKQERNALRAAQLLNIRKRLHENGYSPEKIERIVKKASKGLSVKPERITKSPFAGDDEKIAANYRAYFDLRSHRTKDVRQESRAAQLAYGFLTGVPRRLMESKTHNFPNMKRVEYHILKFSKGIEEQVIQQRFEQWLDEWRAPFKPSV